jgi:uncharacterized protein (DUF486 family)
MNPPLTSLWLPIALLTRPNVFITYACYGHLKFKGRPLLIVILPAAAFTFLPNG